MKPKTLSIREMWGIYKTLKNEIGTTQEYLIDEILSILDQISEEDFLQVLWTLYPKIEFSKHTPIEMVTLLIAGLKRNGFFAFAGLVQGIKNGNSIR